MKAWLGVFALFLILFTINCSKNKKSHNYHNIEEGLWGIKSQPHTPAVPSYVNKGKTADFGTYFNSKCLGNCNVSVGQLAIKGADGDMSLCHGTIIGPRKMITAAHCLERLGQQSESSCEGKIMAYFPKGGDLPARKVGCKRISFTLDKEEKVPDIAILEMMEEFAVGRIADVNQGGLTNGQKMIMPYFKSFADIDFEGEDKELLQRYFKLTDQAVTALVAHYKSHPDSSLAPQVSSLMEVTYNTVFNTIFSTKKSPHFVSLGGFMEGGLSGAGLFNQTGQLVAVATGKHSSLSSEVQVMNVLMMLLMKLIVDPNNEVPTDFVGSVPSLVEKENR